MGGLVGEPNFKMNGFRKLRKDEALKAIINDHAQKLAKKATEAAGVGKSGPRVYGSVTRQYPDRIRAFVYPDSFNARRQQMKEDTLRKVLPS